MKKYCLLTNDVEALSIANNIISYETGSLVRKEGVPNLLQLYDEFGIKSTFFFTGNIARQFPEIIEKVHERGHEIGCHGLTHDAEKAFDVLSFNTQVEHLTEAKDIIENIIGEKIISFRAPALRVNEHTPKALMETGFKIDSSIAPQRFDMFLSLGSIKKFNRLFAPRLPYRTSLNSLAQKGTDGLIEVPISALILPYIGTTLRAFPLVTRNIGRLLAFESKIINKPINILVHPTEYINEKRDEGNSLKRNNNIVKYLLSDLLRNKIKLNNLGDAGLAIYKKEVIALKNRGFKFSTLLDYVNQLDL